MSSVWSLSLLLSFSPPCALDRNKTLDKKGKKGGMEGSIAIAKDAEHDATTSEH